MNVSHDFNDLLSLEPEDVSLQRMAQDIRLLIKLKYATRLTLAVRLAIAHKLITTGQTNYTSFNEWCRRNVVRLDGHPYSIHHINQLVRIGAARNPAKALEQMRRKDADRKAEWYRTARQATQNVVSISAARAMSVPVTGVSGGNIADEVNQLMTAWEHAEDQARRQFLHMIGVQVAMRA